MTMALILVIDDEPDLLGAFKASLELLGYEVLTRIFHEDAPE